MVRPMVNSVKHYVQKSLFTVTASTIDEEEIAKAVVAANVNLANEVREGATIKALYCEMWIRTQSTSPGSVIITVEKKPGADSSSMTTTESAALFNYTNKKNIFYTTQGLTNDQDADAIGFIRQWIKIPKSKQRFGLADRLVMNIHASGALDLTGCGMFIYKEYF